MQASGFVIGQSVPPICDTILTIVKEKKKLFIHLSQTRNQLFRQTFLIIKHKPHWQPMHFGTMARFCS